MALTKPRAYQIFDLDYKQSVRVLTSANISLSGGAPNTVDGVELGQNDRVLVKGQSTASQNGLYIVATVGTGSNGTWIRSVDGNETGEIQAGMIVMVTEGTVYKDTQWKLITNDPITIGTTDLTFELNTSTSQISNGNSNVAIASLGSNITVGVGGTANVAVFSTTGLTANNIATDGNLVVGNNLVVNGNLTYINVTDLNVEDPIIGLGRGPNNSPLTVDDNKDRGIQLWYYTTAERSAFVGWDDSTGKLVAASNVGITNEVVTVNNYGTISTGNIEATGNISPTANITYDLGSTNLRWKDLWLSNSTIYIGNATIGAVGNTLTINGSNVLTGNTGSAFSTTGNVTGGNILTTGSITATGNITGSYVFGNGSQLTGLSGVLGNVGATGPQGVAGNVGATGTAGTNGTNGATGLTGATGTAGTNGTNGATGLTGATGAFTGTLTSNINGGGFNISNVSSVSTTGFISATGNVTAGNIIASGLSGTLSTAAQTNITMLGTLSSLSVTGNVQGGNVRTIGIVSASGNVNGGNVVASANLIGGNITTVGIISATGNITGSYVFGNGSQLTGLSSFIGATGPQGVAGNVGATGTAGTAGGIGATGATGVTGGIGATGVTGLTGATGTFNGTLTANVNGGGFSISNVATIAATTLISATGNVQGGNIRTAGLISATGAVTGAALTGTSLTVTTGNITAGNLLISGAIIDSAQLDIQTSAANANIVLTPNGTGNVNLARLSASGNIVAGNLITAGLVSLSSITKTGTNGVGNIGAAGATFNTIFAKATSAQYADLAEMYVADAEYFPGTVVEFGGVNEVTISSQSHSTRVAGIVSTNPSYLMNSAQSGEHVIAVALVGRVPCQVVGTIAKGDRLVASNLSGVAQRLDPDKYEPACIIGKAMEAYNSDQIGTIEVAVGRT